mgnify:CR=1 FL=1
MGFAESNSETQGQQTEVKEFAKLWEVCADIKFSFTAAGTPSSIRISFIPEQGIWSFIH